MKGQWFIISAVVITSFFVTLSGLLKDYYVVDFLPVATNSEGFYFENVKQLLKNTAANSAPECDANGKNQNITEAIDYTTRKMASLGYIMKASYSGFNCAAKQYDITLTISSENGKKTGTFRT